MVKVIEWIKGTDRVVYDDGKGNFCGTSFALAVETYRAKSAQSVIEGASFRDERENMMALTLRESQAIIDSAPPHLKAELR